MPLLTTAHYDRTKILLSVIEFDMSILRAGYFLCIVKASFSVGSPQACYITTCFVDWKCSLALNHLLDFTTPDTSWLEFCRSCPNQRLSKRKVPEKRLSSVQFPHRWKPPRRDLCFHWSRRIMRTDLMIDCICIRIRYGISVACNKLEAPYSACWT